ncbi:hypothetical protein [Cryptosporangium arvum]|uniref:hypothetical protein n=1 Tax=Cryptosporangium arvum TaxID=80871 RepID=UPI0004AEEAF8|nr:hypothetical protein [Cryptosporangium arvum]
MRSVGRLLGIAGTVLAITASGTAAAAVPAVDRSWECDGQTLCLYRQADGDGRRIEIGYLPGDCGSEPISPVRITRSVFNNNSFAVVLETNTSFSLRVAAKRQIDNLQPERRFTGARRDNC